MKIVFEKKTLNFVLPFPKLPIAKNRNLFLHLQPFVSPNLEVFLAELKKVSAIRENRARIKICFQRLKYDSIT